MKDAFKKLWDPWYMDPDQVYSKQIGPLRLWTEHRGDELHVAAQIDPTVTNSAAEAAAEKPQDIEWRRWICGRDKVRLVLEPRLPDRAIVVRPLMPVTVLPKCEVEFFVSVPIQVAVRMFNGNNNDRRDICEEPTVKLSNSWFGLPVEGELCYALKTRARRRLDELRSDVNLAICPVTVRNSDSKELTFERICLRMQHLSVYSGDNHLWTNRGIMDYHGEDDMTKITFENTPPACDGARQVLAAPREPEKKNLMMRAFGNFKTMSIL